MTYLVDVESPLEASVDTLLDKASPKSPGFQPCYLEADARLKGAYRPSLLPPGYLRDITTSQRYRWTKTRADGKKNEYVKEIFFNLSRGIVKLRAPDAENVLMRSAMDALHYTQSRTYRCVTIPGKKNSMGANIQTPEREVFHLEIQNQANHFGWLGMAGRFLVLHNSTKSELFVFDFRAPW